MKKNDFKNRVALITGSSRGIGLATAKELGSRGAGIVLNGRGEERLEKARAELEGMGIDVRAAAADVSSPEECRDMIGLALEEFGRLDILVNNAGMSMRSNLEELDPETCRKMVEVNMLGCIYPTIYAIPHIKEKKGSIVFISSIGGLVGLPTASIYCATKTGLRGLADSLRCELAPDGVHLGVVYVGFTENAPDKEVAGPGGSAVPHDRPAHMTWKQVAAEIAALISKRKRDAVLTPAGKLAGYTSRLSPGFVEQAIIFARKHNLSEKLGMR